ncbi:MAG: hypothetical protein R2712_15980 [Vicinamibacterales bacterium]
MDDEATRMVEEQLRGRGVRDPRVLAAMGRVRRERFVPPDHAAAAWRPSPRSIDHGQTISRPTSWPS